MWDHIGFNYFLYYKETEYKIDNYEIKFCFIKYIKFRIFLPFLRFLIRILSFSLIKAWNIIHL